MKWRLLIAAAALIAGCSAKGSDPARCRLRTDSDAVIYSQEKPFVNVANLPAVMPPIVYAGTHVRVVADESGPVESQDRKVMVQFQDGPATGYAGLVSRKHLREIRRR